MAKKKIKHQGGSDIPPEYLWKELDTSFVEGYKNGKIIYSNDFYVAMYKQIQSGMTYVEAYKSLGFNIAKTGKDRANSAGKRAVQMAEEGKLDTTKASTYYGGTPLEDMPPLNKEEKLAYLEARVMYLEHIEKAKKTIMQELQGKIFDSK